MGNMQAFLKLIRCREHYIWAYDNPTFNSTEDIEEAQSGSRPEVQGSELLLQFCRTGVDYHDSRINLFVKELLHYCVLDMFTQVKGKGKEYNVYAKSEGIPYIHYLVCVFDFAEPHDVIPFPQGHASMKDWPKVIHFIAKVLETPLNSAGDGISTC